MSLHSTKLLVIWIVLHLSIYIGANADDSVIDQDHLALFPYCGSMYGKQPTSMSRISNSKPAQTEYRWVVLVMRMNIRDDGKNKLFYCSGTVITDK